jgi:hypothetical protein
MNTNSKTKNPANVVPEHVGHASLGQRDDSSVARAAMTHIYQETTPDGQDPVGFGKAASMMYQGIAADQQYCNWVKTTAAEGGCSVQLSRLAKWLVAQESQPARTMDVKMNYLQPEPLPLKSKNLPPPATECSASQSSMSSSTMQILCQLTEAVKDLKEEVADLRQDQPRRTRKKDSEISFSMVSEQDL